MKIAFVASEGLPYIKSGGLADVVGALPNALAALGHQVITAGTIERMVTEMRVQFVLLGLGEKGLEAIFGGLPARYPGRIGSFIGYHEEHAHWIEAGSDFFLMPSRFEPCGLNEMYSLRYGTLPIVRATGGLDDTVEQYDESSGSGTSFKFWEPSAHAIYYATGWAVSTYYDPPEHIHKMIQAAMRQDFTWVKSARQYEAAYQRAIETKRRLR